MNLESGESMDFTEKLPGKSIKGEQERNNRIINSTIACIAAFALVYISFNVVTALFAKRYHLFYKLFFFKVEFTPDYSLWTYESVIRTFVSGPVFCLIAGIICFQIQKIYRKRPGILKTFWLWLGIHYLNFFCTQMVLTPIKSNAQGVNASNLGVVALYLSWEDYTKIIFSIISALLMILIGFISAKPFIQITNSTHHVYKNENRVLYLFQMVLIPYAITSAVALVYFSDGPFILNLSLICTMFIIIISLFINGIKNRMIMIYRLPETGLIENKFLIGLAAALIFMKIFFNNGVSF